MHRFRLILSLAAISCMATAAQASIVYQYVADQSSLTLAQGATGSVNIYLQETISGADTSYLVSQNGLFGGGFGITRTTSGDAVISSQAGSSGNGQPFAGGGSSFSGPVGTPPKWTVADTTSLSATSGPIGTVDGTGTVRTILLGTETFTGGTQTSVFTLDRKSAALNTASYTDHTNLDNDNAALHITGAHTTAVNSPFTITVNAQAASVPEPSSMILCGIVFGFAFVGYRRRMQGAKVTTAIAAI